MKICCVFNFNPLYRYPIYRKMDETFDCDFFFGDTVFHKIESFDASLLKGFRGFIKAKRLAFKGFIWHSKIHPIFKKKYSCYLITGDIAYIVNWIILLYSKLFHKKIYYWSHGIRSNNYSWRSKILYKVFFSNADGIFLYSSDAIRSMKELGCSDRKMFVIHNSLNTEEQTKIYKGGLKSSLFLEHFGNSWPVAIYIGRLQKRKNIGMLLEAIAICKHNNRNVNVVIVGPVEDDDSLPQIAEKYNISDQIWFYGKCYDECVNAKLLYNSNVCVCPTAVGLTAIHSLTYGTPVISNDDFKNQMPEYESIINGETGSFYKKNDVEDLSVQIYRWCSVNEVERERIRIKARNNILNEWSVDYQINIMKKSWE